jgi:glycosyltransferase involved in cell wall biosynthesis
MPVYNDRPYVRQAVDSMLAQTFADFELVIVDDGSTDGSSQLLDELAARDTRIRVEHLPENGGIVRALNRGLELCIGRYIARMDADDIALPHRLERQVSYLDSHTDVVALGTALKYIDARGRDLAVVRHGHPSGSLLRGNPLLHPTVMFRAGAVRDRGLSYREEFRYAEDYYLWLEMSRLGRLASLEDVLLEYRISASASRMEHLRDMLRATIAVKTAGMEKLGIQPGLAERLTLLAERLAVCCLPAGMIRWVYLRTMFGLRGVRLSTSGQED